MLNFLMTHLEAILIGGVDAILLLIPSMKSNNIVQLAGNILADLGAAIKGKVSPPSAL